VGRHGTVWPKREDNVGKRRDGESKNKTHGGVDGEGQAGR